MKPFFQRQPIRTFQPILLPTQFISNNDNNNQLPQQQQQQQQQYKTIPLRQQSAPQQHQINVQRQHLVFQRALPNNQPFMSKIQRKPIFSHDNKENSTLKSSQPVESMIFEIEHQNDQSPKLINNKKIIELQDEIQALTNKINLKYNALEHIQIQNIDAFKQFREAVQEHIQRYSISLNYDDTVKIFLEDLDRKALNLQNHVNDNIQLMKNLMDNQLYKTNHLCSNVAQNINQRLNEDEYYLRGELEILKNQFNNKMDSQAIRQEINDQINIFRQEQKVQESLQKQSVSNFQVNQRENNQLIQDQFQQKMNQIEQHLLNRLKLFERNVDQIVHEKDQQQQEKKQLQQQLSVLKNKFSSIQIQFQQNLKQFQQKLLNNQNENSSLQNQLKVQTAENEFQKKQIKMLEQQIQRIKMVQEKNDSQKDQTIRKGEIMILSPVQKKPSFNQSMLSGTSLSTKPDKALSKPQKLEISFEEFADFKENSLNDSIECSDSNSCEFFYPNNVQFEEEIEQKQKKQSQLKVQIQSNRGQKKKEPEVKKKMIPQSNEVKMNIIQNSFQKNKGVNDDRIIELRQAIKRRMLYNSQAQAPLECTYSSTGQVSDIETGLFILNETGDPITITQIEKNLLINEGLIKL